MILKDEITWKEIKSLFALIRVYPIHNAVGNYDIKKEITFCT